MLGMAFIFETTDQYDSAKYLPLGTVMCNSVEAVSFTQTMLGPSSSHKGSVIQEAVDRLVERGMVEFKNKVSAAYPNTVKIVGLKTSVSEVGREDQHTFMVFHASGTCLAPFGQAGGFSRKTKRSKTIRGGRLH
jgi:hypothetical protein